MPKLYFRYGAMGAGKSMNMLAVAHTYRQQGKKVVVVKPAMDVRTIEKATKVVSRTGLELEADLLVECDTVLDPAAFAGASCVLVDESQFLSEFVIEQLRILTAELPVICYGLRTDFRGRLFEGSRRLMELADNIEEVKVTCQLCNRKGVMNMRFIDGKPTTTGDQVSLGGDEAYSPTCFACFHAHLPLQPIAPISP
jgi:thymidine kinase